MKKIFLFSVLFVMFTSCQKTFESVDNEEPIFEIDNPPPPPPPPPPLDPNIQYLSFRGIRPDDPNGLLPIENPERGFRFEYIMMASNLTNPYHNINYSSNFYNQVLSQEAAHGNNKIKLAQVYFYLTEYLQTTINPAAISNMQYIFDQFKAAGVKVVLRFAYRYDDDCGFETMSDVSNHLAVLKNFMQANESMIYVVQAGFLGKYGEWHTSRYDNNKLAKSYVIRKLLSSVPASRRIQVRETRFKNDAIPSYSGYIDYNADGNYTMYGQAELTAAEKNRIGFHNDYFVLDQGAGADWDYKWPDNDFYQAKAEAPYTTMDGEMPYDAGNDAFTTIAYGTDGGWYAARRMRAHAYSSFSIVHNEGTNINAWKSHLLYPSQFRSDGTLVTDDYFQNSNGTEVPRKAFDYIRDHLGYRFQIRNGVMPARSAINSTAHFEFTIKNFGFSRTVNPRTIYLVLIDQNNNVRELSTNLNTQDLYPTFGQNDGVYTISKDVFIDNSFPPGQYRVGIWIPDASSDLRYNPIYAIRLANGNMQWWQDANNRYLINIVGTTEVY